MTKLAEQLRRHEGLRLKPYKCPSGKLTIGYGRNLVDRGISKQEAEMLLINEIKDIKARLTLVLKWFSDLDPIRQDCLVNMAYNMGVSGLLRWKKTLEDIKERRYKDASQKMRESLWAGQVGKRALELADQLEKGVYENGS